MKAVDQIYKLPEQYKEIAICIFLKEMTIEETSKKLCIPVSTVGRKKKKIPHTIGLENGFLDLEHWRFFSH